MSVDTTTEKCPECRCPYGAGAHPWTCRHQGCDCHVEWESQR